MEKKCGVCLVIKPLLEFGVDRHKKDGHKYLCKICHRTATKKWRMDNPEKTKELDQKYRDENRELIRVKNKRRYQNLTIEQKFNILIQTAQKRTKFNCFISVNDLKEIWQKQEGRCAYTKLPLTADANQLTTMSLDRIDSDTDYVVGNVQLVCVAVNRMKSDFPEKDFIGLCNLITQNNTAPDYPTELARIP